MIREFRIKQTGEVLSSTEYLAMFPNCSFPTNYVPDEVDLVQEGFPPTRSAFQRVIKDGVEQINDKWVTKYSLVEMSVAEKKIVAATTKAAVKKAMLARMQIERNKGHAFTFPEDVVGHVQIRDTEDLLNINGQVTTARELKDMGITDPVMVFRDLENVVHNMTPQQMINMGLAAGQKVTAIYQASWAHHTAIDTFFDTWDGISSYNINTGWPT